MLDTDFDLLNEQQINFLNFLSKEIKSVLSKENQSVDNKSHIKFFVIFATLKRVVSMIRPISCNVF